MYYARIWATPPPPYAACILNQWPHDLIKQVSQTWTNVNRWSTPQVRYNKALFTNAAMPIICAFLLFGIWVNAAKFELGEL